MKLSLKHGASKLVLHKENIAAKEYREREANCNGQK